MATTVKDVPNKLVLGFAVLGAIVASHKLVESYHAVAKKLGK